MNHAFISKNSAALWVALGLSVQTVAGATFIQNPSFEANYNDTWPHYGPIDLWNAVGGTGINDKSGPFHNTSAQIPDRARAAFLQGPCTIGQTITGLTPGQTYCLQFFYDARNCCGGTVDLTVRLDGAQVDRIVNIRPTPTLANRDTLYFRNVQITPAADTALLEFVTTTLGDATAVLDAVSLTPCATNSLAVKNPSFEASGDLPDPFGIAVGENLAGWTIGGEAAVGVVPSGQGVADNGVPPDQDHVAFLNGESSISQLLEGLEVGTEYELSFAYNQRMFDFASLRVSVGGAVVFEEDVDDVGVGNPYHTFTGTFRATEISSTLLFEQTTPGQVVLLDNIGVRGASRPPLPCLDISPAVAEIAPGQAVQVSVTVPGELTAAQPAVIRLRSPDPAVAQLGGVGDDGTLALNYAVGETKKNVEVMGVGRGSIRVEIVDSAGLCTENDLTVTVLNSFVRNASFESSPIPAGVGYGPIVAWDGTGGTGLNGPSGPFHDNGSIPDRRQVAFIQAAGSLSQTVFGLTPGGNYWLQFYYNARNCCGGTINLQARFGGTTVATVTGVAPGGYVFYNASFSPAAASGLLEFVTTADGDASLLLDGVSIVERTPGDVVLQNPSFESTGIPAGVGYIQPSPFAGWTTSGGYGPNLDGVGPFTDNGDAPEQDIVAFIQGSGSMSQQVSGLTPGQDYTLSFAVNARNCCTAGPTHYAVSFGGVELVNEDLTPVGGVNPYVAKGLLFSAPSADGELLFSHQPPDGDRTLLLDNIRICSGDCRPAPRLQISYDAVNRVTRLAWDSSYSGYRLQFRASLSAGAWADSTGIPLVEGNDLVVLDDVNNVATRFYRLIQ
jgi:hypothetical protein